MKLQDILDLARAGYKFKEVKELLEWVETNPTIQEADEKKIEEAKETIDKQEQETETTDVNKPNEEGSSSAFAKFLEN